MAQSGQRKCLCCGDFFDLDQRNRGRQKYCSASACRAASKAASQAAWLSKPNNTSYFSGPVHVARVQAWRAAHPGYGSKGSVRSAPLQDSLIAQVDDLIEESPNRGEMAAPVADSALQDLLNAPSPLLAGLIAHLFEVTLQDDIAATTRRLVQLGHDVINRSRDEDPQTSAVPRAAAPSTRAVQLG
jgi:hypothetical protein